MNKIILTGIELRTILIKHYPGAYIVPIDRRYFLPSDDFARKQVVGSTIKDYNYRPEIFDCDDFAIMLAGKVKERQYKENWQHPMAFGFAVGALSTGQAHASNLAVTSDKNVIWIDCIGHDMTGFQPRIIWV